MAKITANGDALTITTNITVEQYEKVMNFNPELLKLKDEEGNELFRVAYSPFAKGDCSKYGITLASSTPEGKMFLTTENVVVGTHTDYEEERKMIIEKYARVINNINMVEAAIASADESMTELENVITDRVSIC